LLRNSLIFWTSSKFLWDQNTNFLSYLFDISYVNIIALLIHLTKLRLVWNSKFLSTQFFSSQLNFFYYQFLKMICPNFFFYYFDLLLGTSYIIYNWIKSYYYFPYKTCSEIHLFLNLSQILWDQNTTIFFHSNFNFHM
jgi:hypothetical protein